MYPHTRGLLFVHSTPSALCPHIEWAAEGVLGMPVDFDWTPQYALPGSLRAEITWTGEDGTAQQLVSTFLKWNMIRFEVTEHCDPLGEGHRWSFTPSLGLFHAPTSHFGDIMLHEERVRKAMADDANGTAPLCESLDKLLGTAWDAELDIFRHASEDAPIRWLHRAG